MYSRRRILSILCARFTDVGTLWIKHPCLATLTTGKHTAVILVSCIQPSAPGPTFGERFKGRGFGTLSEPQMRQQKTATMYSVIFAAKHTVARVCVNVSSIQNPKNRSVTPHDTKVPLSLPATPPFLPSAGRITSRVQLKAATPAGDQTSCQAVSKNKTQHTVVSANNKVARPASRPALGAHLHPLASTSALRARCIFLVQAA